MAAKFIIFGKSSSEPQFGTCGGFVKRGTESVASVRAELGFASTVCVRCLFVLEKGQDIIFRNAWRSRFGFAPSSSEPQFGTCGGLAKGRVHGLRPCRTGVRHYGWCAKPFCFGKGSRYHFPQCLAVAVWPCPL